MQEQSIAPLFQDEFILKSPSLPKSIKQQEPCTFLNGYIHLQYLQQSFMVQQKPRFSLLNLSSTVLLCFSPVKIKSSALPSMLHSQKPCFALDDTFPKALLLLTWLIPKWHTQSFQKRCMIWADFLKQTFFTKIIHFFMLYMPVKSDGQKVNWWPRYEAAKWGQVRFCHAKCDSFHLMVRKCMLFFPLERFCNNAISFQKRCKKVPSVNGDEAITIKRSVQLEK